MKESQPEKLSKAELVDQGRRQKLASFFDSNQNVDERRAMLLTKAKYFVGEDDLLKVSELAGEEDRDKFVEEILALFKPTFDLMDEDPVGYERAMRKKFVEENNYQALDDQDIISFGRGEGLLHLHIASSKTINPLQLFGVIKSDFKKLAQIVQEDEDVEELTASSWLVARNPGIFKKMGFEIQGSDKPEIDEEGREVGFARMSRDKLLEKYGKKQ